MRDAAPQACEAPRPTEGLQGAQSSTSADTRPESACRTPALEERGSLSFRGLFAFPTQQQSLRPRALRASSNDSSALRSTTRGSNAKDRSTGASVDCALWSMTPTSKLPIPKRLLRRWWDPIARLPTGICSEGEARAARIAPVNSVCQDPPRASDPDPLLAGCESVDTEPGGGGATSRGKEVRGREPRWFSIRDICRASARNMPTVST